MPVRFLDGQFAYATTAEAQSFYTASAGVTLNPTGGRVAGRQALDFAATGGYVEQSFTAINFQMTAGAWVRLPGPPGANGCLLFSFKEDATTVHVTLRVNSDMVLEARMGTPGADTVLATGTTTLVPNHAYYIECLVKINDTSGVVEARIEGLTPSEISVSGVDTRNGGTNGAVGRVRFGPTLDTGLAAPVSMGDFYVLDNGAGLYQLSGYMGPLTLRYVRPTGAGTYQMSTLNTGSGAAWERVSELAPDDDASTVYFTTSTQDTYQFGDLAAGEAPLALSASYRMKMASGTASLNGFCRSAGTDVAFGSIVWSATSYGYFQATKEVDPATNAAFTNAGFNAAEFGLKCASATGHAILTQMGVSAAVTYVDLPLPTPGQGVDPVTVHGAPRKGTIVEFPVVMHDPTLVAVRDTLQGVLGHLTPLVDVMLLAVPGGHSVAASAGHTDVAGAARALNTADAGLNQVRLLVDGATAAGGPVTVQLVNVTRSTVVATCQLTTTRALASSAWTALTPANTDELYQLRVMGDGTNAQTLYAAQAQFRTTKPV